MNRQSQSMFYCSFAGTVTPNNLINTILSEVNAKSGEAYYLLSSKFNETVLCAPIGSCDYYRRGLQHPFRLHSSIEEIYKAYKENTHKDGMFALELCDAFLTSVLKKVNSNENNRVYQVTSEIANDCLNSHIDGIIYPSLKFEGYPNIVFSPDVVDRKLSHQWVSHYEVVENLGYGIYDFEEKVNAVIIQESNHISWQGEKITLGDGNFISYSI